MKHLATQRIAAPLLGLALAAAAPLSASAQGSDGWQFEASLNGWFPAISGTTMFPSGASGPSIDVSMGDVVDALKFTFQGTFEARRGQWGLWTDLVYADFGASRQHSRDFTVGGNQIPVGVDANLVLDVKSWIWTLAGTYRFKDDAEGTMDGLFGARMLDMSNQLSWSLNGTAGGSGLPPQSGSSEVSATYWDAVIGLKGRALLGSERKWFLPFYVDVGAGQTKLTWQVNAGIGYQFDWGAIMATWRYLDYDFKSDSKLQSISFSGPVIGVAFKF